MISSYGRVLAGRIFTPVARLLLRLGVGPDAVTIVGALGSVLAALWFLPRGQFLVGPVVIAFFLLTDTVDGIMARQLAERNVVRSKEFGAFLDSTLDRVADGAVFGALVVWFLGAGDRLTGSLALTCLVLGSVVPYARARAEGLGMSASGGIAERADRLIVVLVGLSALGLGAPTAVMTVILGLLALASAVTVWQRSAAVHRQAQQRLQAADDLTPTVPSVPMVPTVPSSSGWLPRARRAPLTGPTDRPVATFMAARLWSVRSRRLNQAGRLPRRERRRAGRSRTGF